MTYLNWHDWIREVWDYLKSGQRLDVPSWLPHPVYAGFAEESIATPAGQLTDWVLPLDDESRIHVHEYSDGRLIAHRDRIDPNRSVFHAIGHIAFETNLGKLAVAIGLITIIGRFLKSPKIA